MDEALDSFTRSRQLLGEVAFERLRSAHVVLVGYGAVGSFAAEALARSGLGYLRLIDADSYEASNINRQLGANRTTIGRPKVEVGRARLESFGPIAIETRVSFADANNYAVLLAPFADGRSVDLVIDAIDSLDAKAGLIAYCLSHDLKIISSMGAARKRRPELICVSDIWRTEQCPLARALRKRLRKMGVSGRVDCVYSREQALSGTPPKSLGEPSDLRSLRPSLGSLITVTGSFGLRLAALALDTLVQADVCQENVVGVAQLPQQ